MMKPTNLLAVLLASTSLLGCIDSDDDGLHCEHLELESGVRVSGCASRRPDRRDERKAFEPESPPTHARGARRAPDGGRGR